MNENKVTNDAAKVDKCQTERNDSHGNDAGPQKNVEDVNLETAEGELAKQGSNLHYEDTMGDVNMEATITTDDVVRAGGLGATDDISSFLPVAMDSTDFEASLRDARDFEGPQGEISRPGLGWTEPTGSE